MNISHILLSPQFLSISSIILLLSWCSCFLLNWENWGDHKRSCTVPASPLRLLTTQHLHPQVPLSCLWQNYLKHIPFFVEAPFLSPQRHCLSNSPLPLLHHQLFPLCWIIPISIETCSSYSLNYFQSCVTLGIISRFFSVFLSWALGSFFSWSPSRGNPCRPPELFLWAVLFAVLFCSVNSCTALFSLNSQLCPSPRGTLFGVPHCAMWPESLWSSLGSHMEHLICVPALRDHCPVLCVFHWLKILCFMNFVQFFRRLRWEGKFSLWCLIMTGHSLFILLKPTSVRFFCIRRVLKISLVWVSPDFWWFNLMLSPHFIGPASHIWYIWLWFCTTYVFFMWLSRPISLDPESYHCSSPPPPPPWSSRRRLSTTIWQESTLLSPQPEGGGERKDIQVFSQTSILSDPFKIQIRSFPSLFKSLQGL